MSESLEKVLVFLFNFKLKRTFWNNEKTFSLTSPSIWIHHRIYIISLKSIIITSFLSTGFGIFSIIPIPFFQNLIKTSLFHKKLFKKQLLSMNNWIYPHIWRKDTHYRKSTSFGSQLNSLNPPSNYSRPHRHFQAQSSYSHWYDYWNRYSKYIKRRRNCPNQKE